MPKEKPVIQKITQKTLNPNVVKNINDESIQGDIAEGGSKFPVGDVVADNISTNKILGAITPRSGVVQADLHKNEVDLMKQIIDNSYNATPTTEFKFGGLVGGTLGIVVKFTYTGLPIGISFMLKKDATLTGTLLNINWYDYDIHTGRVGLQRNPTVAALNCNTLTTAYTLNEMSLGTTSITERNSYYFITLTVSGTVPTFGADLYIQTMANTDDISSYDLTFPPTVTPVLTPLLSSPIFSTRASPISQPPEQSRTTDIDESVNTDETFITSIDPLASYDNGVISAITHPKLDYLTADVVLKTTDKVFPGAYYGSRIEQSVHTYLCMLGGQLSGRTTSNDPNVVIPKDTVGNPRLNYTQEYPMYKRAKDDNRFVRMESDVMYDYRAGRNIEIGWGLSALNEQKVNTTGILFPVTYSVIGTNSDGGSKVAVTATDLSGSITTNYDIGKDIIYNKTSGRLTNTEMGLNSGTYEYAIEFIDRTGMVYSTCSQQLPQASSTTLTPATTILPVSTRTYPTFPEINHRNGTVLIRDIPAIKDWANKYAIWLRISPPNAPYDKAEDYPVVNIYRRYKYQEYVIDFSGGGTNIGSDTYTSGNRENQADFVLVKSLDSTYFNAANQRWEYVDITPEAFLPAATLKLKGYYIPSASDMALYKGRLIAVGDATYPNYVFCARDYITDFWLTDAQQVSFPHGDSYFTAIKQFKDALYIFSNSGTWELRLVSSTAPFFAIRPVSTEFGCISTSDGIVDVGKGLLIPTKSGLKLFNGIEWASVDKLLNRVFSSISTKQVMANTYGSPSKQVGTVDGFTISGCYDPLLNEVWYVLPGPNSTQIFTLNINSLRWTNSTLTDACGVKRIKQTPHIFLKNGNIYRMDATSSTDYLSTMGLSDGAVIPVGLTTIPINFGEKSIVKSFRMWGKGTVTISIYLDKSTTTSITKTYELDRLGDIGAELRLGWMCRYASLEISSSDPNMQIKGMELLVQNSGIKLFEDSV